MLSERASLLKRSVLVMIWTRKALGLEQSPTEEEVFWWRPLLDQMEILAKHRRLDQSGIAALRCFTQTWDERMRQLAAAEHRPAFSSTQISSMSASLVDYERWLRTHFPNTFLPDDLSSN